MVHTFDGFNHFIRLDKGDRLVASIDEFMRTAPMDIAGAWVNIIGAVQEVTLGFYDLNKKTYEWRTFSGLREITGVQGNLAADASGKLMLHAHGTFADRDFAVVGGHVKDFVTAATAEIFVHRSYKPLARKDDPTVGLQTWDLHDDA